jgi:hypothetical protein
MGTLVISISAGILFIFGIVMIIGQKWAKDSRREEEEQQRVFDFEDEWMDIHRN